MDDEQGCPYFRKPLYMSISRIRIPWVWVKIRSTIRSTLIKSEYHTLKSLKILKMNRFSVQDHGKSQPFPARFWKASEVTTIFAAADANSDGELHYVEFASWVTRALDSWD